MTPQERAAQFAAEHPDAAVVLRTEGAEAERGRIQAVRQQAMPGHDALVERLAFDGQTTGPEAAVQILAAERARASAAGAERRADAPAPVRQTPIADVDPAAPKFGVAGRLERDMDSAALDAAAKAHMARHPGVDYIASLKAVQLAGA